MYSRQQFTDLTYMGGTGPCGSMTMIFDCGTQSWYTSLTIKSDVNRTFNVFKTPVTDLTYMGGTGPCAPMTIIFGSVIQSQNASLNIKFGVNRTFHVVKTPVYRFDLYGRYRNVRTDNNCFWWYYLELVYKPKYQIWCATDVPCTQDPSLPI